MLSELERWISRWRRQTLRAALVGDQAGLGERNELARLARTDRVLAERVAVAFADPVARGYALAHCRTPRAPLDVPVIGDAPGLQQAIVAVSKGLPEYAALDAVDAIEIVESPGAPGHHRPGWLPLPARVTPEELALRLVANHLVAVHQAEPIAAGEGWVHRGELAAPAVAAVAWAHAATVAAQVGLGDAAEARSLVVDAYLAAEPTPLGRQVLGPRPPETPRFLLVNEDRRDFVNAWSWERAILETCHAHGLEVDALSFDPCGGNLRLTQELGTQAVPRARFRGTWRPTSEPSAFAARCLGVIANVNLASAHRLATAFPSTPLALWDRHLHEDPPVLSLRRPQIRAWTFMRVLEHQLIEQGLTEAQLEAYAWPFDRSLLPETPRVEPGTIFTGGESGRDNAALLAGIAELPVRLVMVPGTTSTPQVRATGRLPFHQFLAEIAGAQLVAIPVTTDRAAGLTVLVAAMLLGKPIAVTRTRWTETYVEHGKDALLVDNPEGWRSALQTLLDDRDLATRLGQQARARAEAECDLSVLAQRMVDWLQQASL